MDKTNKTPLEEMLDKEYPLTNKEFRGYYRDKRETFMKGYSFCLSSIKQEQKPSDQEIENIASEKYLDWREDYTDGERKWAFINGARWHRDTFASPSKEIDWERLKNEFDEWFRYSSFFGSDYIFDWFKQRPEFSQRPFEEDKTLAIEFADWIVKKDYYPINSSSPEKNRMWIGSNSSEEYSTTMLYDLFLSQNKGKGE